MDDGERLKWALDTSGQMSVTREIGWLGSDLSMDLLVLLCVSPSVSLFFAVAIVIENPGFLKLMLICWMGIPTIGVPVWVATRHRVGVVSIRRFALIGVSYAVTLAVISLLFIAPNVARILEIVVFAILAVLILWSGFLISWLPVWGYTDRVVVVAPGHCVECNYNLRVLESEVCPECGRGFQFENEPCVLDDSDRASVN